MAWERKISRTAHVRNEQTVGLLPWADYVPYVEE